MATHAATAATATTAAATTTTPVSDGSRHVVLQTDETKNVALNANNNLVYNNRLGLVFFPASNSVSPTTMTSGCSSQFFNLNLEDEGTCSCFFAFLLLLLLLPISCYKMYEVLLQRVYTFLDLTLPKATPSSFNYNIQN